MIIASLLTEWIWPVGELMIGLGLVIFFHELGHFIVAKRVGIHVYRFAIGFGPRLFGIRKGETDYCLCAIPLGGYVGMVGQEDFGAQKEAETDPRAFCRKSIGARFAVISAGVVMNVIFASVLFVVIGLVGKDFQAPLVGGVVEDFPAAKAQVTWADPPPGDPKSTIGLRGGDRILKIEGPSIIMALSRYRVSTFQDVAMTAALADDDDEYLFTIERRIGGTGRLGTAKIGVKKLPDGSMFAFGISTPQDVEFGRVEGLIVDTPFEAGDRILAVDGHPVGGAWDLDEYAGTLTGEPVTFTVRRGEGRLDIAVQPSLTGGGGQDMIWDESGGRHYGRIIERTDEQVTLALESGERQVFAAEKIATDKATELQILGMVPRVRISAVQKKLGSILSSPAANAGLRPGDVIVGYGDRGAPTWRQMLDINEQAAGEGTGIVVLRGTEQIAAHVVPTRREGRALIGIIPDVDIATPVVAAVLPDSRAAEAGIEPGMVVTEVNGREVHSWIDVYRRLCDRKARTVKLTCRSGNENVGFDLGAITEADFDPDRYEYELPVGRPLVPLLIRVQKANPLAALGWGGRETLRMVLSTYVSLRSMIKGNVSPKTVTGPVGIGRLAIRAAQQGPEDFVYLLAFISAAIAVFNFLPLPVLDGGHALFLLIEKVRGRPLPVRVMNFIQVAGLVLLGGLFLAITWQDISQLL